MTLNCIYCWIAGGWRIRNDCLDSGQHYCDENFDVESILAACVPFDANIVRKILNPRNYFPARQIVRVLSNSSRNMEERFLVCPWRLHESHDWNKRKSRDSRRCWSTLSKKELRPRHRESSKHQRIKRPSSTWNKWVPTDFLEFYKEILI